MEQRRAASRLAPIPALPILNTLAADACCSSPRNSTPRYGARSAASASWRWRRAYPSVTSSSTARWPTWRPRSRQWPLLRSPRLQAWCAIFPFLPSTTAPRSKSRPPSAIPSFVRPMLIGPICRTACWCHAPSRVRFCMIPEAIAERAVRLALKSEIVAIDGTVIATEAQSLCIHGDTAEAVEIARRVRTRSRSSRHRRARALLGCGLGRSVPYRRRQTEEPT